MNKGEKVMKSMVDVYTLLKNFGTYIYTRDRVGDLALIEEEIKELYNARMIEQKEFQTALLLIRQELVKLKASEK